MISLSDGAALTSALYNQPSKFLHRAENLDSTRRAGLQPGRNATFRERLQPLKLTLIVAPPWCVALFRNLTKRTRRKTTESTEVSTEQKRSGQRIWQARFLRTTSRRNVCTVRTSLVAAPPRYGIQVCA